MPAPEPIGLRLSRRIEQDGNCIVWTGAKRPNGYGVIGGSRNARNYYDQPHRVVYRIVKGDIPDGMQIDHLCRNRACVQPAHLEAVSQAENVRRENAMRWHGRGTADPLDQYVTCTVRDLVALLTGTRVPR